MTLALLVTLVVLLVAAATGSVLWSPRQDRAERTPPPLRAYLDEVAPVRRPAPPRGRGPSSPRRTSPGHAAPSVGDSGAFWGACDSGAGSSGGDGGGGGC